MREGVREIFPLAPPPSFSRLNSAQILLLHEAQTKHTPTKTNVSYAG